MAVLVGDNDLNQITGTEAMTCYPGSAATTG